MPNRFERACCLQSAAALSLLAIVLLGFRAVLAHSSRYSFIPGNLALAWAGFLLGWALVQRLKVQPWRNWQNILLTLFWLFFLPNTWYVLTDFVHIYATGEVSILYDIVMMSTLMLAGFLLGFGSLAMVHHELRKRLDAPKADMLVGLVLLLSSFAIYLGRVLRWNSWDVLTNPAGLIVNVSDRVANPLAYPSAVDTTILLFVFLSVSYFAFWRFIHSSRG